MLTQEIRKKFIQYFKERGHSHIPSSPVIPHGDPTLLFNNAGMNQFKDVFLGQATRDYNRAVTSQKCIRAGGKHNDLDNVGFTSRHMTFFEMLGNFSFGDYFKKEAIQFAWELTLSVFQFPEEKIWVSVYEKDDEAYELWSELIAPSRIVRLGEKDNFWAMGDVGPCGPCSELLFDRGERFGSGRNPHEDESGERFFEFWNLVFMQYNREKSGHLGSLPQKSIDTGTGLERIVSLKMGVDSVFQTDILRAIISSIEEISGKKYVADDSHIAPVFHVIADHIRTLAFAIADGAKPGNVDRGYVLRKILRRAVRFAKKLQLEEPFLAKLLPILSDLMGDTYPELKTSMSHCSEILTIEEESFYRTLKRGGNILSHIVEKAHKSPARSISGEDAFKLKDTYGFPIEEILLLAKDNELFVNLDAYELLEEEAKERSRAAHKNEGQEIDQNLFKDFAVEHGTTEFVGYETPICESTITALVVGESFVDRLEEGQTGALVLAQTPFYAEKGGQISDSGTIEHHGALFEVEETLSPANGVTIHKGTLKRGTLLLGEPVNAVIDQKRRARIAAHHSATHLLHWALEQVLGPSVKQGGSMVAPDSLRFDFNYHKAMTAEEIRQVERLINEKIRENRPVKTEEMAYDKARQHSEIKQFFGEKYGKMVRVVSLGEFSHELCGGTHAKKLGELGYFRILKESSVGAGLRRIEAACGATSEALAYQKEDSLQEIASLLGADEAQLLTRVKTLLNEMAEQKIELRKMRALHLEELAQSLRQQAQKVGTTQVITALVDVDSDECATLANRAMELLGSGVILIGVKLEERCQILLKISDDLVQKGLHANVWIKELGALIQGGGGGKKDAAQAGGKKPEALESTFSKLLELVSGSCS